MVAVATVFILIALLTVGVTLVDAARSTYWRAVAVQRRLLWEERTTAPSDAYRVSSREDRRGSATTPAGRGHAASRTDASGDRFTHA